MTSTLHGNKFVLMHLCSKCSAVIGTKHALSIKKQKKIMVTCRARSFDRGVTLTYKGHTSL